MERWRRPVKFVVNGDDVRRKVWDPSREGYMVYPSVTVTPEDFARMRLGYVCCVAGCFEPHEEAFPEHCAICGFEMRAKQLQRIEDEYEGTKWIGTKVTVEEEEDRLDEAHYKHFYWNSDHSILVPKSI